MKKTLLLLLFLILLPIWIWAQGFGGFASDQPFFAKDSTSTVPVPPQADLMMWWHAGDLTAGQPVTNWVDRIMGSAFTSSVASAPSTDGTNVAFTGTQVMTNLYINFLNVTNAVVFVLSFSDIDSDQGILCDTNFTYAGQPFYGRNADRIRYHVGASINNSVPLVTVGNYIFDYTTEFDGGNGVIKSYTNNVLSWDSSPTTIDNPNQSGYTLGNVYDGSKPMKGKIYDLLIYTNSFSSTRSNFHYWATNTYGFSP